MQDRETHSLWSQVLGEAIQGPLEGKKLTMIPAIHTTYGEFKQLYPQGKLLRKPAKGMAGSHYSRYFQDKTKLGIFGRKDTFDKLDGKDLIYGIRFDNSEIAIAKTYLQKHHFAVITSYSHPVIVMYDARNNTTTAFQLPDITQTVPTVTDNRIVLDSLSWNALTGKAVSGNTTDLQHVPITTAFWFAWASFFPNTELIK